jgi:hypothetical protein
MKKKEFLQMYKEAKMNNLNKLEAYLEEKGKRMKNFQDFPSIEQNNLLELNESKKNSSSDQLLTEPQIDNAVNTDINQAFQKELLNQEIQKPKNC